MLWNQIISKQLPGLKYVLYGVMLVLNIFENECFTQVTPGKQSLRQICMRKFIMGTCKIISTGEEVMEAGFSEPPNGYMVKIKVTTNHTESSDGPAVLFWAGHTWADAIVIGWMHDDPWPWLSPAEKG